MNINELSFNILTELNNRQYLGGRVQKNAVLQCKINELLIALHDAIDSPKGTIPDSADKFYCHEKTKGSDPLLSVSPVGGWLVIRLSSITYKNIK